MSAKCGVCTKTAYPMESIRAIDKTFHKACFKCSDCGMTLNLNSIESLNGVLYCKVHLPSGRSAAPARPPKTSAPPSSSSSGGGSAPRFGSAGNKCPVCTKTVYPTEQVAALGEKYHKACFRCSVCQMSLNLKSFQSRNKILFCKPHLPKESHTVVTDDVHTERARNAPKRTMAMGVRTDGEIVDASNFTEDDFQRESHLDSVNQTTESVAGTRAEEDYEVNQGGGGGWGAPPASDPAPAPAPAAGGWGAPAPAAQEDNSWGAAEEPAADDGQWGAEEPVADDGQWGAEEPVADDGQWGAEEPVADDGQWGAEEPVADDGQWGEPAPADDGQWGEPAAEEWGEAAAAEPAAAAGGDYLFQTTAMYEYEIEEEGELGFPEGATINILEELSADWWMGEYNGATGMLPANYTSGKP